MNSSDKKKLKKLGDMQECVIAGSIWTYFADDKEFKVSPYGLKGDYDKNCYWVSYSEIC